MRKLISFTLMLVMVLTLLPGCHGSIDRPAFAIPETFDTSREYEITFWAKNDTNRLQVAVYEQAIEDFEALYPNITVNLVLYTDYGRIYNDVITNLATGTTPNVCITYPDHIATYLTGNDTVVPLDELMADPQYGLGGSELRFDGPDQGEIVPQFLEECVLNGCHYALPYMRSTEACYINRTYVEALGYEVPDVLTWDYIWEVSEAAMAKDADGNFLVNGQKIMIPFIYKSTDNMMIQMLYQQGAGYSSPTGEIQLFNEQTEQILHTVAAHTETGAFSTFKISSYPANFLNAGQCIFAVDSTAGATWMGSQAPLLDIPADQLVEFDTEVRMIPQYDPSNPRMISQGPSICIFNSEDPQEVLASWLFVQFMLTNDVQIGYAQTEGYLPVTTKALESPEYQDYLSRSGQDNDLYYDVKIEASMLLLDNIENTFVTPVFNGSVSLRNAAGQLIETTVKSVRRKQTVDDAFIAELYTDVSSLYRLDQLTGDSSKRANLGELPGESVALLSTLALTWVCIGGYFLHEEIKKKKAGKSH